MTQFYVEHYFLSHCGGIQMQQPLISDSCNKINFSGYIKMQKTDTRKKHTARSQEKPIGILFTNTLTFIILRNIFYPYNICYIL